MTLRPLSAAKSPALKGTADIPGDKSISHRALLFAALTDGAVEATGLGRGGDNLSTAAALQEPEEVEELDVEF